MSLDVSRLSPSDLVAALRSFPRRWGELLAAAADDPDRLERPGPDGRSAREHLEHAARSAAMLANAVDQVLAHDDPVLAPAVADPEAREWVYATPGDHEPPDSHLHLLTLEVERLGDLLDHSDVNRWARSAVVAGADRRISALDLVRETVRTVSDHLRRAGDAVGMNGG